MNIPRAQDIDQAVSVLRNGGVIAMPSDTLYALSASAYDAAAVRRVFEVKGREEGKALPLLVADLAMAERIGQFNRLSRRLADRLWPGQVTLIVRKRPEYDSEALAGGETVALRAPDNAIARSVLEALGEPVTGTSANFSGGQDPVSAAEVRRQIGDHLDLILDAGETAYGIASTIVDCTGPEPRIVREGAVGEEFIAAALRD